MASGSGKKKKNPLMRALFRRGAPQEDVQVVTAQDMTKAEVRNPTSRRHRICSLMHPTVDSRRSNIV